MWLTSLVVCVIIAWCKSADSDVEMTTTRYLQKYGYLNDNVQGLSAENYTRAYHQAIALFQEYCHLPGNGTLNEETLLQMHKPRCGVKDISSERTFDSLPQKWPKKHLTWNFHLANERLLRTTRSAFDLWAANSALTFERNTLNPDIIISFREGLHANIRRSEAPCSENFDGPGGILAHAYGPNDNRDDFISEVHVDKEEPWHVQLTANPPNTMHLLQTLTHEIGHAIGMSHSPHRNSIMFPFVPEKTFPVTLSLEDILTVQNMYGARNGARFPTTTTTISPTTTTVATSTTESSIGTGKKKTKEQEDLCALRHIDNVLILNDRIYVAHKRRVWSIDIERKTFQRPLLLTDYMKFLPDNFTRLSGAYQTPSNDLVLFLDDKVYMVEYPSFELIKTWPRSYTDIGLPANAKINAVVSNNRGRSFVIYNDHLVGEMNDCSMRFARYHKIQDVFPGIPNDVSMAFRYVDGIYFVRKHRFYKFNDFTRTVTASGTFDLKTLSGIACPRDGLLRQLRDLLERFVRITSDDDGDNDDGDDDDAIINKYE